MGVSFSALCRVHAGLDLLLGASMLLGLKQTAEAVHGSETASKLLGSTEEDRLAIHASESLVGVLLVDVGLILGLVATVKDERFRRHFCGIAIGTHCLMAAWRYLVASRVPALSKDWKGQLVGDALMGASWAAYLLQAQGAKTK